MSSKQTSRETKLDPRLKQLEAIKQRIREAAKPDAANLPEAQASDLVNSHPLLHSVLFAHLMDGGPDEGATLILWGCEDGLGGLLNVKPWGVKAFLRTGSLLEALDECERLLTDPQAKWVTERKRKRSRGSQGYKRG